MHSSASQHSVPASLTPCLSMSFSDREGSKLSLFTNCSLYIYACVTNTVSQLGMKPCARINQSFLAACLCTRGLYLLLLFFWFLDLQDLHSDDVCFRQLNSYLGLNMVQLPYSVSIHFFFTNVLGILFIYRLCSIATLPLWAYLSDYLFFYNLKAHLLTTHLYFFTGINGPNGMNQL